jgi:serine/threonine protein kinase
VYQVFARKGIRRIGHVTPKAIENERHFVASLREAGGHPNIVCILDHGTLGNWLGSNDYFIDMERCDVTLTHYVEYLHHGMEIDPAPIHDDTLHPAFVRKDCTASRKVHNLWTIGRHIASGLEFLHARNHVHRDLKPGNGTSLYYQANLLSSAL